MSRIVLVFILFIFSFILFLIVRRGIISDTVVRQILIVVGILSGLAAITAITVSLIPNTSPGTQSANNPTNQVYSLSTDNRIPPVPPEVSTPTFSEEELFSIGFGYETGCYPEGGDYTVRLVKSGQDDYYATEAPYYYMIDEKGVQETYYLENNLSNAVAS